jgi:hypothetical protein
MEKHMEPNKLEELFEDKILIQKIRNRLPSLFQLAEEESSRAGRIGMEVGSVREKIIIALLIHKFGFENVNTDIPITEKEIDVKVFNRPISIKTKTGRSLSGIKIIWTVDAISARDFLNNYRPICDTIFTQIIWNDYAGFYYIPIDAQNNCFKFLKAERYIKLPKEGTNPRGVEITEEAMSRLLADQSIKKIDIFWNRSTTKYNIYKRWIELWQED